MKNEHSVKTTRQALEIMYQPNHGLLINKNENGNQNNCHDNNCTDNNCGINNCHDKNCDNISFHGNFHSNGNGYRNINTHRNAKENRINENENSMENNNDQYDNFFIYNDDKEDESCFTLQNKNQISCKNEPIAIIIIFHTVFIFIDTISQSFVIANENDNSEIKERVMKPLKQLARETDAAVLASHHIGKAKLEEGATREGSHRGRGASAFGDQSRHKEGCGRSVHRQRLLQRLQAISQAMLTLLELGDEAQFRLPARNP